MSKQVWCRQSAPTLSATASTINIAGGTANSTVADALNNSPCPAAGVLSNLTIALDAAPASGTTKIFTLRVNNVDSAMAVTIDDAHTSATYSGAGISVSAGDLLCISYTKTGTPGSSSLASVSWVFTGSNGVSIYMGTGLGVSTTTPAWTGPFVPGAITTTAANLAQNVVAAPGTITGYYATMGPALGSTGSYKSTIYLNGVAQDGTSGTPDTRVTLVCAANTRVNGNTSFTLPVVAGDLVYIQIDSLSSPSSKTLAYGIAFTATNAGDSNMCWGLATVPNGNGSSTNFNGPQNIFTASWSTEPNRLATVADKFKLSGMQIVLTAAPGGGASRTFVNRKNSNTGSMSVALSASASGSDTSAAHADSYSPLDTICFFESAVSGSPAAATGTVGFIQTVVGGNPPGKAQTGNKKGGGGATNQFNPGGTIVQTVGNAGVSSVGL